MPYSVKPGVKIDTLNPVMSCHLENLAFLWQIYFPGDADGMTITSGNEGERGDGVHGADSLHYDGLALDLRVKDVDKKRARDVIVPVFRLYLGGNYDVVWEETHIHIEYDPVPSARDRLLSKEDEKETLKATEDGGGGGDGGKT